LAYSNSEIQTYLEKKSHLGFSNTLNRIASGLS